MVRKQPKNRLSLAPLAVGIAIGAIIVVTAVVIRNHERGPAAPPRALAPREPAATSRAPVAQTVSAAAYRVATQFACTCGACGGKPLESCDCPTAVEERGFIQQQLDSGRTETEAADALQAKYGGRKAGAADTPPLTDAQVAERLNQATSGVRHLAAASDRDHIISHFKCPCEQCAIDELRDCECPHPNGAQEVKQFIDTTIAKQQHTVGEIVALVEQRYGGRIR